MNRSEKQLQLVRAEGFGWVNVKPDRPGGALDSRGRVVWFLHCHCGKAIFDVPVPVEVQAHIEAHLAAAPGHRK